MDVFGIFIFFLGILLAIGAYTPYGLHIINAIEVPGKDCNFFQMAFGSLFMIAAIFCLFIDRRTIHYKYYMVEKIRARDFKYQSFKNGQIITYADSEEKYMWPIGKWHRAIYKDRLCNDTCLGLKRYYNNQKELKEVIVLYSNKYK